MDKSGVRGFVSVVVVVVERESRVVVVVVVSIEYNEMALKVPSQNSTNSDLALIFRVSCIQLVIKLGDKNFTLSKPKSIFLAKGRGGTPPTQNQQKNQPTLFWLE